MLLHHLAVAASFAAAEEGLSSVRFFLVSVCGSRLVAVLLAIGSVVS